MNTVSFALRTSFAEKAHDNLANMLFVRLVKPFIRPWVLVYLALVVLNWFVEIPYLNVALYAALFYGTVNRRHNFEYYPRRPAFYI